MRNNRGKRGQMRVIEVILALFILVFALTFASFLSVTPASPKYQSTELEKLGYNVLHDLDKLGLLPKFVYANEWGNITAALRVNLPINVYFNLTVYQINEITTHDTTVYDYNPLNNNSPIFYGEPLAFSFSTDVASVTYCMVGAIKGTPEDDLEAKYEPRVLVLKLTRGQ